MKKNPCVFKINKRKLFHVVKYCPFGFWFARVIIVSNTLKTSPISNCGSGSVSRYPIPDFLFSIRRARLLGSSLSL